MYYYKRNIGDYHKKAGRLSLLEHGIYTLLIDACYDRECFPTKEEAIEWVWARTEEEIKAVEFVLSRFFECEDGRFFQKRIKEEVERYKENCAKNSKIAKERGKSKQESHEALTNRERTVNETCTNGHLTKNQEPITNNQEPNIQDRFDEFWRNYPLKKSKAQALRAFKKINPDENLLRAMISALGEQKRERQGLLEKNQFAPEWKHPPTWLNGECWNDETSYQEPASNDDGMFQGAI